MKNKIIDIMARAKKEHWAFPKTFNMLKNAGVSSYSVSWLNGYSTYIMALSDESLTESDPEWFTQPNINPIYSETDAKYALRIHQEGKTTFLQWIHDMANAGVTNYIVNMEDRTVIYYNREQTKSFIESVPDEI
ncbi:MAG: DUF1398 family protein [Burkholderiales bacterium]|nr:DUF1398 family protein [Burkholderiales bacterium]